MEKFSINRYISYLFSALTLFLCTNIAQAHIYAKCNFNSTDGSSYEFQACVYNNVGYSSFGKATGPIVLDSNKSEILSMSDSSEQDKMWSITKNTSKVIIGKVTPTYTIYAVNNAINQRISSNDAHCVMIKFDVTNVKDDDGDLLVSIEANAEKTAEFFNHSNHLERLYSFHNPIALAQIDCKSPKTPANERTLMLGDGTKKKYKCTDCCSVS